MSFISYATVKRTWYVQQHEKMTAFKSYPTLRTAQENMSDNTTKRHKFVSVAPSYLS